MLLRKKSHGGGGGFGGILSEGTEIDGEVRFAEELRVDGRISGRVLSEQGRLMVGETGYVEAEVLVAIASISGTLSGTLVATSKVEIHATGRVYGSIHAPALIIEEGAVFEGSCEMASVAVAEKPPGIRVESRNTEGEKPEIAGAATG